MIRVLGCNLMDDGTIVVEWMDEDDHKPEGSLVRQTSITARGQEDWDKVGYYAKELRQDLEELVHWYEKFRLGRMPEQR
jgi:hypothetical protein